ncbi:MAG TPA: AarF/UbiB family protein [Gemmatimonadales bacterium]|nr:AarF/UbiB family protein [Gemmatimonadales bacterium]
MSPSSIADEPRTVASFEVYQTLPRQSLFRRFLTTQRHLFGLVFGALSVDVDERRGTPRGRGFGFLVERLLNLFTRPFLDRKLRDLPFPVQLRRRLEMLGPTYIKLGQILSLREDILPKSITEELKHLLATLPAVPYPVFCELIVRGLGRPLDEMFLRIDEVPLGSASIGQVHRATTRDGDPVIIKVVKPGIPAILRRDAKLLGMAGWMLELVFPQYGPKRIIREFSEYTLREVDLRREADNAETFAANFVDERDIVFPRIYREFSAERVLTMEFFDGLRPDSRKVQAMSLEDRERLVDLGAEAIIRMIYKDGFFHADLHPGNLIVLPGPQAGFIDLGMVGRMHDELRRTLLYYYYALVMGDAENAARYLSAAAEPGRGGDPAGFRRDVAEISTRWRRNSNFDSFSLGQLILESVSRGAEYRMFFPVEMVLMVKALVTFEGVGQMLLPGFDVAEVSKRHVRRVFIQQFSPVRLAQEGLRGAPDLVDALVKMPLLITEGLRVMEKTAKRSSENPFAGLRGTLIAGFSLVAGAIILGFVGPQAWLLYVPFFVIALVLAVRKGG